LAITGTPGEAASPLLAAAGIDELMSVLYL